MSDKLDRILDSYDHDSPGPDYRSDGFPWGWNDDRYAQDEPEVRADQRCACGTVGQHDGTCWTCKLKAEALAPVVVAANAALWGACANKDKCETCAEIARVLAGALNQSGAAA